MKILVLFSILLYSVFGYSQNVELKNASLLIKSKDRVNLGEYNTSKSFNPQIGIKVPLFYQNLFVEGEYHNLDKINFFNYGLGYKIKIEHKLLFEFLVGYKDFYYFDTVNGDPILDKKGVPYLLFRGHLALWKVSNLTIIGDGLMLYGLKVNDFRSNEVGVGMSVGFKNNGYYNRIGYRLEHQSTYDSNESNSIFKNVLYYKINF